MRQPLNIRTFIQKNRDELESFGPIHAVSEMVMIGSGARREVTSYHLNRHQALLTCILSRTEKGKQIRAEEIRR